MGSHHARVLSSLDGVKLVGIVDPARAGEVIAGLEVTASLDDLLTRDVDYCVVAAPTASHESIALRLASEGIHALIEKPLASTVDEAQAIAEAFNRAGLIGAVGHIERFNPAIREMRRRISDGQIGRILQVATRRQGPFPARIGDVGVVKDLATHDLDLTMWVTGHAYSQVAAQATHRTGRPHEDMVTISACLSDGTIVSHVVNWLSPFKDRTVVVTGERGALIADTLTADLTYYANSSIESQWHDLASLRGVSEGDVIRYAISKPEPLRLEHEGFRNALLGTGLDFVSLGDGLEVVSVADRVLESASWHRSVKS
jgi:predicted dehydrogenase